MNKGNRFICMVGIERDGAGKQLDARVRAEGMGALRRLAAERFGGYTMGTMAGGWINDAGALVEEGAVRFEIYTDKDRAYCAAFARDAGRLLNQAQVVFEFEPADFEFVECAA